MKKQLLPIAFISIAVLLAVSCQKSETTATDTKKVSDPIKVDTTEDTPLDLSKMSEVNRSKYECVQSLCGTEYPFKNKYETNPQAKIENQKIALDKLGKNVRLLMGQVIKNELKLKDIFQAFKNSKSDQLELKDFHKGLLNAFKYLADTKLYYALKSVKDEQGNDQAALDPVKLKSIKPNWSDAEIEIIENSANIFLTLLNAHEPDVLEMKIRLERAKKITVYENGIGQPPTEKNLTETEALELQAKSIIDKIKTLESFLVPELLNGYDRVIVEKALSKESFSENDKLNFFATQKYIDMYYHLILSKVDIEKLAKLPFDLEKNASVILVNYDKQLGLVVKNKTLLKGIFKNSEATCLEEYAKSLTDTPTALENEKALDTLKLIQVEANSIVEKKKKSSIEPMNIEFILPRNQTESLLDWNNGLDKKRLSMKETENKIDMIKTNDVMNPNLYTSLALRYANQSDFFDSVIKICQKSAPPFINDAAYPAMNVFIASWVTVKNLDYGIGIMAHEISHILSDKYNDIFKFEKDCLSQKQGSDQYQEEDFADFLSSKILANLRKNGQYMTAQNMSCGLGNINKTNPDELTTTNLDEKDDHSSQLYRILSVASAIGVQTNQCSTYLEKYEPKAAIFKNYCQLNE